MKHWRKAAVGLTTTLALAAFSLTAQAGHFGGGGFGGHMGGVHMGGVHMGGVHMGGVRMGSFSHMRAGPMGGHIAMSRGFGRAHFAHNGFGPRFHHHGRRFFAFYPYYSYAYYPYYDDYYYDDDYDDSYCYWRHGRRFCRY